MKTAVSTPMGTPMMIAPAVTYKLPRIMGKMPYIPFEGRQVLPNRKSKMPISDMAGIPFANRKILMVNTARMDTQAAARNTTRMADSLNVFIGFYRQAGRAAARPAVVDSV